MRGPDFNFRQERYFFLAHHFVRNGSIAHPHFQVGICGVLPVGKPSGLPPNTSLKILREAGSSCMRSQMLSHMEKLTFF